MSSDQPGQPGAAASAEPQHIVILGNGIAGVTAARHVRKLSPDVRITMVSGESAQP